MFLFCFFFQAEDGIRGFHVTGVQTCALPIWRAPGGAAVVGVGDTDLLVLAEVVPGDVHAPVVGAGRAVVDPARLAVVAAAAVDAGAGRPGDAVYRHPGSQPAPAAAGGDEDGDPLRVGLVVDDHRVAVAGAVAGAERPRGQEVPGDPVVGRVGAARIAAGRQRGVVVGDDDRVALGPGLGLGLGHVRVGSVARGVVDVGPAVRVRRGQLAER